MRSRLVPDACTVRNRAGDRASGVHAEVGGDPSLPDERHIAGVVEAQLAEESRRRSERRRERTVEHYQSVVDELVDAFSIGSSEAAVVEGHLIRYAEARSDIWQQVRQGDASYGEAHDEMALLRTDLEDLLLPLVGEEVVAALDERINRHH